MLLPKKKVQGRARCTHRAAALVVRVRAAARTPVVVAERRENIIFIKKKVG